MSIKNTAITVAHGDGIGPEIMEVILHILKEPDARLDINSGMQPSQTIDLLDRIQGAGGDFIDDQTGYSLGQGQ
ncbi:MAG TPA: hypothetical protein VEX68_30905 [Bryobacteraceae bacterium]|nr:hypothetical protein [Bryobacteraceae bacterium]